MKKAPSGLRFSPTDLSNYLECLHLVRLELDRAQGKTHRPSNPGTEDESELLRRKGLEHEQAVLQSLQSDPQSLADLTTSRLKRSPDLSAQTIAAMKSGVPLIYQGCLVHEDWIGYPDFLERFDGPSALGDHLYIPVDAKLAQHPKATAVLQLATYAALLEPIQGRPPPHTAIITGDKQRWTFRQADFSAYLRRIRADFTSFLHDAPETYPLPVARCVVCPWDPSCTARRIADDHLSQIAGMRSDQVRKLASVPITTMEGLAKRAPKRVKGIGDDTLAKLQAQAAIQVRERDQGRPQYELIDGVPDDQGLGGLPEPDDHDLFFDMEGDPHYPGGGLEYLFGVVTLAGKDCHFQSWRASDRRTEKLAFEGFIDFVLDRWAQAPGLHVYHYASYEATALKKLADRHSTRQTQVDRILRAGLFVDLYRVVRQSIRVGTDSYSIKKLEPLYMKKRSGDIRSGGSSIVAFEQWLENADPDLFQSIVDYNEEDCVSTRKLRDWLEDRRKELEKERKAPLPRPPIADGMASEAIEADQQEVEELVRKLLAGLPADESDDSPTEAARRILAGLLDWQRREDSTGWVEFFRRCEMDLDELFADTAALARLTHDAFVGPDKSAAIHRYRFDPDQEHKLKVGDRVIMPCRPSGEELGTVHELDELTGTIAIRQPKAKRELRPQALIPSGPIESKVLKSGIRRLAQWVVENPMDANGRFRAARDLLLRHPPRLRKGGGLHQAGNAPGDDAVRVSTLLDETCLPIQGPPGAGKTYTGAQMIVALLQAGKKVGLTATSHKAIGNLLTAVSEAAGKSNLVLRAIQKADEENRTTAPGVRHTTDNAEVATALASGFAQVAAGTAWLFARTEMTESVDVLFVDEASQMSLATTLSIAGAGRNLVLLGDPQQLSQPSQAAHPPGAEKSALEHVLGDHPTIPADRGIFLDTTWRMHPKICAYVSESFYEGRLRSEPACERHALRLPKSKETSQGLAFVPVDHEGNRTSSVEEAERIRDLYPKLLASTWTNRSGEEAKLTADDILVVAPYNAQVNLLRSTLPPGARVGTVDKFQGQEAPVVLYSMAASTADDIPRGLDFLYSPNRCNVAVSRAQALSIIVANPRLLSVRCKTPEQMKLVNGLCRYVELACLLNGSSTPSLGGR